MVPSLLLFIVLTYRCTLSLFQVMSHTGNAISQHRGRNGWGSYGYTALCSHLWAEVTSIYTSVAHCGTLSYQGTVFVKFWCVIYEVSRLPWEIVMPQWRFWVFYYTLFKVRQTVGAKNPFQMNLDFTENFWVSCVWCHRRVIPALERLRQEEHEFKVILEVIA